MYDLGSTAQARCRRALWLALALSGVGCSRGGAVDTDGPVSPTDLAPPADEAPQQQPDLRTPMTVAPCSYRERFQQVFGHPFSGADVAFVTTDNAVSRGIDKLDLAAQKNQVPDIVKVKGNSNRIKEIQLLAPGANQVLASRAGAYIYGLGYAMWLDVNGYGESGITEATLLRQFGMEEPSYQQLVGLFRVLTRTAEAQVPAADRADFQTAAARLMAAIESGQLSFALGTGHAADFPATAQTVNGKTFSFQLSDGYGMDPQLGFQRNGTWGPLWQTYSPGGGWSASAPGMQPKCGGCTVDQLGGKAYLLCDTPRTRADALLACQRYGGTLATVSDVFVNSLLRGMAPNAGSAWIGLNDLKTLGTYEWADGQPATYLNWTPGQPDHWMNQERCVQLYDGKTITQWNDISCDTALPSLCQLP